VKGQVPGTTVIAVSGDRVVAEWSSLINGERHPKGGRKKTGPIGFTLEEVPVGEPIRLFVIEGGDICSLGVKKENAFRIAGAGAVIDFGLIQKKMDEGRCWADPEHELFEGLADFEEFHPEDIPAAVMAPPAWLADQKALVDAGIALLADEAYVLAKVYFEKAVEVGGPETDTAKFLLALTRVVALGFDLSWDSDGTNFDKIGDLLRPSPDCRSSDVSRVSWRTLDKGCLTQISERASIERFLPTVRFELESALGHLNQLSPTFTADWYDPKGEEWLKTDYGDVLFVKAVIEVALASIAIQDARHILPSTMTIDQTRKWTIDQIQGSDYQDFLKLKPLDRARTKAHLARAKAHLVDALTHFKEAMQAIKAEMAIDPDQTDDWITFDFSFDMAKDAASEKNGSDDGSVNMAFDASHGPFAISFDMAKDAASDNQARSGDRSFDAALDISFDKLLHISLDLALNRSIDEITMEEGLWDGKVAVTVEDERKGQQINLDLSGDGGLTTGPLQPGSAQNRAKSSKRSEQYAGVPQ
jgi:hypothetical protein